MALTMRIAKLAQCHVQLLDLALKLRKATGGIRHPPFPGVQLNRISSRHGPSRSEVGAHAFERMRGALQCFRVSLGERLGSLLQVHRAVFQEDLENIEKQLGVAAQTSHASRVVKRYWR
jgi:hypothetical protein